MKNTKALDIGILIVCAILLGVGIFSLLIGNGVIISVLLIVLVAIIVGWIVWSMKRRKRI